jgi:hypothetical protein
MAYPPKNSPARSSRPTAVAATPRSRARRLSCPSFRRPKIATLLEAVGGTTSPTLNRFLSTAQVICCKRDWRTSYGQVALRELRSPPYVGQAAIVGPPAQNSLGSCAVRKLGAGRTSCSRFVCLCVSGPDDQGRTRALLGGDVSGRLARASASGLRKGSVRARRAEQRE